MYKLLILLSLFVLAPWLACTNYDNPQPGDEDCATNTKHLVLAPPSNATVEQLQDMQAAGAAWGAFTEGRGTVSISPSGSGRIEFLTSASGEYQEYQAAQRTKFQMPDYTVYAWTSYGPVIHLVLDAMPQGSMRSILEHEMGHALGLRWPGCQQEVRAPFMGPTNVRDCDHAADRAALMYPAYQGLYLTPGEGPDKDFCKASCLCN